MASNIDPVDEAKDMFWSLTRKAKSAGKSALKSFKKTVGIPTGTLSEANPRYYMVISSQGALVRQSSDLTSPQVSNLRFGDVVTCVELLGRRARIVDPVDGWVSLVSNSNEIIFELTFPPDKKTQIRTMERRFEKMKQEQSLRNAELSPMATPVIHRNGDVVDDEADNGKNLAVNQLKSKIVFKSSTGAAPAVPVPALGPVLKAPVTAVRRPPANDDLLDFGSPPKNGSGPSTPESVDPSREFSLI